MLNPADARFHDCWEDGIAPRWKDAPDDPKYGFGKDRGRFRVAGMTFMGHAGLLDVYFGTLGDAGNPGIQFCQQASDGFLIGDRWVSCRVYDDAPGVPDSDDPGWGAALFARYLRHKRFTVHGVPPRPAVLPEVFSMMRAEYARIACLGAKPSAPPAAPPRGTRISGSVMYADAAVARSDRPKAVFFPYRRPGIDARYDVHAGDRRLVFVGQYGELDIWRNKGIANPEALDLVAVMRDGGETPYRHDMFCDGACASTDAPSWVQPVVDWIVQPKGETKGPMEHGSSLGRALGHADDCQLGRHAWSTGPVARESDRVCKWCGARKGDGAAKAAVSDDDLADALKESEWYVRFAEAAKRYYPDLALGLHAWVVDRRTSDCYVGWEKPLNDEMRFLIAEIESGRIYGSRNQCAVCDQALAVQSWKWTEADGTIRWVHCHSGACDMDRCRHPEGLSAAAAVLRARRLLVEKGGRAAPVGDFRFPNGTSPGPGDKIEDRSGHGNDLTTKPGNPLPCSGCGKPSTRALGALRVCDSCGDLLLWSRACGKQEVLEKFAAKHAEQMAAELRDPHMRHGLVEQTQHLYAGRRGFSAGAPLSIAGKSDDEADAARQRQKDAENRLVDAFLAERREEAERRRNRSRVRTDAECRAVRERMIRENVPAWLDPRRK